MIYFYVFDRTRSPEFSKYSPFYLRVGKRLGPPEAPLL